MIKNRLLLILPVCTLVLAALTGCNSTGETTAHPLDEIAVEVQQVKKANDSMIQEARQLIQSGDLVLRTGTDYASEQVKALSKQDQTYSHAGIALVNSGRVYIYHVEPDNQHIHDKVRKELLDSFCNPAKNLGFAVARYTLTDEQKAKLLAYMDKQYQQQVPFDKHFDLETDDQLYCSEMIKKGLAQATGNQIVVATDRITDRNKFKLIKRYFKLTEKQIVTHDLVPIDRLYLNPSCTVLKRYPFQTL